MADVTQATTGPADEERSRWVSYDAGEWQVVAASTAEGTSWGVVLLRKDRPADEGHPILSLVWMSESTACLVAEAVAVAVAWVLGAAPGVEEEA